MKKLKVYCIYNAEGSIWGELKYLWKKYTYNFKCSLCDITHNTFLEKFEWKEKVKGLKFKLETIHLDEQPSTLKKITKGETPCVVLENENRYTILLKNIELNKIEGDVDSFFKILFKKINEFDKVD
jgi:hypothetical protein